MSSATVRAAVGSIAAWLALLSAQILIYALRLTPSGDLVILVLPLLLIPPLFYLARAIPIAFGAVGILLCGAYTVAAIEANVLFLGRLRVELLGAHPGTFHSFAQLYRIVEYPLLLLGASCAFIWGLRGRQ